MKKLLSSFSNSVRFWCSGVVSFVWESPCLDAFAMSLKMSNRKSTNGHSHYLLLFQWIIIKKTKQKHNDLPFNKTLWDDTAKSIPPLQKKKQTKKSKSIIMPAGQEVKEIANTSTFLVPCLQRGAPCCSSWAGRCACSRGLREKRSEWLLQDSDESRHVDWNWLWDEESKWEGGGSRGKLYVKELQVNMTGKGSLLSWK